MINLGCGKDIRPKPWVNVDKTKSKGVDIVHNLNILPYPFKTNSVDEIYLCHVLEHLNEPTEVMEECWRILKPNGKITVRVPFWNSICNVADIDHRHAFYEYSMGKFTEEFAKKWNEETHTRFKIIETRRLKNPSRWFRLFPIYLKNWIPNLCLDIAWDMIAVKEDKNGI
jgi:ubiquinone/menaquinone biosynthesis C-methylase UbiE